MNRVRDAVVYLGSDTIKALTLSAEAVGKLAPRGVPGFSIEQFQRHATLVARIAAGILPKGAAQQDAITAALLHDIGQLVLIADDPSQWQRLTDQAQRRGLPLYQVEHDVQGITHAATGAYLLSLWGLPDGVVEAVAHHHDPLAFPVPRSTPSPRCTSPTRSPTRSSSAPGTERPAAARRRVPRPTRESDHSSISGASSLAQPTARCRPAPRLSDTARPCRSTIISGSRIEPVRRLSSRAIS